MRCPLKGCKITYGSPRIHAELRFQGETCSRKRIANLMKKEGIKAKMKKRFKVTTQVNPKAKAAPNLLKQDFTAQGPNQRWAADLTYVATGEGCLPRANDNCIKFIIHLLSLFLHCSHREINLHIILHSIRIRPFALSDPK